VRWKTLISNNRNDNEELTKEWEKANQDSKFIGEVLTNELTSKPSKTKHFINLFFAFLKILGVILVGLLISLVTLGEGIMIVMNRGGFYYILFIIGMAIYLVILYFIIKTIIPYFIKGGTKWQRVTKFYASETHLKIIQANIGTLKEKIYNFQDIDKLAIEEFTDRRKTNKWYILKLRYFDKYGSTEYAIETVGRNDEAKLKAATHDLIINTEAILKSKVIAQQEQLSV
jgi:hypothetical protein